MAHFIPDVGPCTAVEAHVLEVHEPCIVRSQVLCARESMAKAVSEHHLY